MAAQEISHRPPNSVHYGGERIGISRDSAWQWWRGSILAAYAVAVPDQDDVKASYVLSELA
jgi:hypothetical protein